MKPATDERFQCSDNPMRNEGITRLIAESQSVSVMMGSMWENCLRLIARVRQEQKRANICARVWSEQVERSAEVEDEDAATIKRLRALLKVARCPESCDSGVVPVQIGDDEWTCHECEWCAGRRDMLAAHDAFDTLKGKKS